MGDEHWVIEIYDHLAKNMDEEKSSGVIVSRVPHYWSFGNKDAFIPQFVGLGLYHHFRPELPLTDKFKLVAPLVVTDGSFLNSNLDEQLLNNPALHHDHLDIQGFYEVDVSSNYDYYLRGLTVDALFLLCLLQSDFDSKNYIYSLLVRHGMPVVNAAGVELTMGAIKNDVFMLENQIPISFLKRIMEVFSHSPEEVGKVLGSALQNFCEASCPLVKFETLSKSPENYDHLLGLMYRLMVPESKEMPSYRIEYYVARILNLFLNAFGTKPLHEKVMHHLGRTFIGMIEEPRHSYNERNCCSSFISLVFRWILRIPLCIFLFLVYFVVIIGKQILRVLSYLFGMLQQELIPLVPVRSLSIIINPLLNIFHDFEASFPAMKYYATIRRLEKVNQGLQGPDPNVWNMSCEAIPATELHLCGGISFRHIKGRISSIEFNEDGCEFKLPRIKLDVNSEVIITNLLVYEQLTESEELKFSSYIQLMKSLIDTREDAELLVREKIIDTELSGEVVHQLFKGLNKSIRPVFNLELAFEVLKLLSKYNENRNIKRVVTKYSICSGKVLIVLAVLIFLVLTAVQTYCSAFGCAPASKFSQLPQVGNYGTNNLFLSST